jgi:hypothetical protein
MNEYSTRSNRLWAAAAVCLAVACAITSLAQTPPPQELRCKKCRANQCVTAGTTQPPGGTPCPVTDPCCCCLDSGVWKCLCKPASECETQGDCFSNPV